MRPLVIGVGNRWRGDDGIGPKTIEALAALGADGPEADLVALDGEPGRLVAVWEGRSRVVIVDAIVTGDASGTVHCIAAHPGAGPDRIDGWQTATGSHGNGIAAAIALGRALDRLPEQLVVVGVEPGCLDHGDELSPAVAAAIDIVTELVTHVVNEDLDSPCA
jgi:hydrogenase maturation protease